MKNHGLPILMALAALAGCSSGVGEDAPAAPQARRVRAAEVVLGPGAPAITASGLLQAKDQKQLSFKVGGIVGRIRVEEGATVRAGELLAELERTEVSATVTQAREAAVKAERDLRRAAQLHADDVVTQEQLEDAQTAAAVARAALRAAEFNSGYAAIHAPGAGTVLRRLAEERELVSAGTPVLVLADTAQGYVVRAALSDREIVRVRLGDPVDVRLDAWPERPLAGSVAEIARAADPRTGTFDIEVRVDAAGLDLASGMVAKLRLEPRAAQPGLAHVPIAAIVEGDRRQASVFVLDDAAGQVRERRVQVAFIDGDRVAVASGLEPGERVVTDGAAYLADAAAVTVVGQTL